MPSKRRGLLYRGPSVCLSAEHIGEPCKNGLTDWDVVWDMEWGPVKFWTISVGPDLGSLYGKHFWWGHIDAETCLSVDVQYWQGCSARQCGLLVTITAAAAADGIWTKPCTLQVWPFIETNPRMAPSHVALSHWIETSDFPTQRWKHPGKNSGVH